MESVPTVKPGEVVSISIWRRPKARTGIVLMTYTDGSIRVLPSSSQWYKHTLKSVAANDMDELKAKRPVVMADSLIVYGGEFRVGDGG